MTTTLRGSLGHVFLARFTKVGTRFDSQTIIVCSAGHVTKQCYGHAPAFDTAANFS